MSVPFNIAHFYLGEARMRSLLNLQVFIVSENNSYIQVCGVAVSESLPLPVHSIATHKRTLDTSNDDYVDQAIVQCVDMLEAVVRKVNSVMIYRHNIFYGGMKHNNALRRTCYFKKWNTNITSAYVSSLIGVECTQVPEFYDLIYFHPLLSKVIYFILSIYDMFRCWL